MNTKLHRQVQFHNFQSKYVGMWNFKVPQAKKVYFRRLTWQELFFQILNLATRNRFLATGTSNDVGRSLAISTYILFPLLYFGRGGLRAGCCWFLCVSLFACWVFCLIFISFLFSFCFILTQTMFKICTFTYSLDDENPERLQVY